MAFRGKIGLSKGQHQVLSLSSLSESFKSQTLDSMVKNEINNNYHQEEEVDAT